MNIIGNLTMVWKVKRGGRKSWNYARLVLA